MSEREKQNTTEDRVAQEAGADLAFEKFAKQTLDQRWLPVDENTTEQLAQARRVALRERVSGGTERSDNRQRRLWNSYFSLTNSRRDHAWLLAAVGSIVLVVVILYQNVFMNIPDIADTSAFALVSVLVDEFAVDNIGSWSPETNNGALEIIDHMDMLEEVEFVQWLVVEEAYAG